MKKLTVFALLCAFALGACSPNILAPAPTAAAPQVNSAATVNAIVQTTNAQTLTAQPSPTTVPVTNTFTVTPPEASPTTAPNTNTAIPNLTTTPATATSGLADLAPTSTPTLVPGKPTASPTNGILTYGTLPPENHPYTYVTLINESKREAYISLQVVTAQGYTIIEYPVKHVVKIKIPVGDYTYVVWVGGRQIVGYFHASQSNESTITIFKDKVMVH